MGIVGVIITAKDRKGFLRDISTIITAHNINITFVQQFIHEDEAQIYLELEDVADRDKLIEEIRGVSGIRLLKTYRPFDQIYGKRVIVIGGGAQVSQVVLGAVTEADRHNLRGERISIDTIPLVGEEKLAEAVRAVGRLHRASALVLAGSIMGGGVVDAVKELREEHGIPVISLNMAGGVPDVSDLIVTDPVQAGVMAVMAVSDTARFDIKKSGKKRF
ncbi:ACT domain protein [archaeon BMS3Bbin16]|nr:ACT domain protein [archaeon BMS3Bbin16]